MVTWRFPGIHPILLCGSCLLAFSCTKRSESSSVLGEESFEYQVEFESEDMNLEGPLGNLLSLIYRVPVFDGEAKSEPLEHMRFVGNPDVLQLAVDSAAKNPKLQEALGLEYAGHYDVVHSQTQGNISSSSVLSRFYGICEGGRVHALQLWLEDQDGFEDRFPVAGSVTLNILPQDKYFLVYRKFMSSTYREDIQGCRERFELLVDVIEGDQAKVRDQQNHIEAMHFAFSFLPTYAGFDNLMYNDQPVLGTAEVTADIASLGFGSIAKIGWKSLRSGYNFLKAVRAGTKALVLGANTVRMGALLHHVREEGAEFSDVPTVVLLVAETGFVLMSGKRVPRGKIAGDAPGSRVPSAGRTAGKVETINFGKICGISLVNADCMPQLPPIRPRSGGGDAQRAFWIELIMKANGDQDLAKATKMFMDRGRGYVREPWIKAERELKAVVDEVFDSRLKKELSDSQAQNLRFVARYKEAVANAISKRAAFVGQQYNRYLNSDDAFKNIPAQRILNEALEDLLTQGELSHRILESGF